MHKLQEIAWMSDTMLFYEDVEKEMKCGTAATLEGFVAMKTRPIHNSVKKWADRAISGAKSVVGWIKTGGKKNREIIEITENRQKVQFKNEQYKKPRKKPKSRDSTVYSTMRQTSLCGFISLKNDLYWTVRGLLYLFQQQESNIVCCSVINRFFVVKSNVYCCRRFVIINLLTQYIIIYSGW